jgi:lysophospholipase L1-like esterase
MNWQIQVPIPKYTFDLSHEDKIFSAGSCFAQHMADRLIHYKFSCTSNPYGILFHPIPLLQNLTDALKGLEIDENLFLERDEAVFHYSCHSSVWAESKVDLKTKLQDLQLLVAKELKESKLLILTFGTAFLYQLASEKAVANCHKQPKNTFTKELSSSEEIQSVFQSFYSELKKQNPKIQILLTVSPVRHIRDGVHENNVSKSALLLACDAIQKSFKGVHYFPSYEIVMDELRDYRFYEKDRVHPNEEARAYVWRKFAEVLLTKDSSNLNRDLDKLFSSIDHRAFRETSEAHQRFLEKTLELALGLNEKVDLEEEIKELKKRLQ